jgi:hypothetical protein
MHQDVQLQCGYAPGVKAAGAGALFVVQRRLNNSLIASKLWISYTLPVLIWLGSEDASSTAFK